jgi:hypothetical protein
MSFLQSLGVVSWFTVGLICAAAASAGAREKWLGGALFFLTLAVVSFSGAVWLVTQ